MPLRAARLLTAASWIGAALAEIPWHIMPGLPPMDRPVLAVVADSVTAGIGENEAVTWPQRIAQEHGVPVHDYSQMGATVKSARQQAARLRPGDNLVLLEIGGNDLLGSSTAEQFETGLNRLLLDICRPERTVVMFELPLPPAFNRYGGIQRRLARRHGVILIPKRLLMRVLCRGDTTLDSIHLSQAGHDELSEAVWSVVRGAYGNGPGASRPRRP
jgi:acyl-CoA thioesterase-1